MTISPTEGVSGLFGGLSSTGATSGGDNLDKDAFLELLVAQLKYQDPMNPTDSGEFLSQSAQFTALERMTAVAEQSAQSVVLQLAFGASSLVGRSVTYADADGVEVTGTVGSVRFDTAGPVLDVDGESISMNDVVTVHATPPAVPGSAPDPTDETSTGTDAATSTADQQPTG